MHFYHGHIIKLTQHIGILTFGWDGTSCRRESSERFKKRVARILCLSNLAKFDYSFHFYFYERKQNKCGHVLHCDAITIKEDCCRLNFF